MYLVRANKAGAESYQESDSWYIQSLRQADKVLSPGNLRTGGYYVYKERYGMVCIVKILENTSRDGWIGYRLMVKRVLYSSWHIPRGTVFETGFHPEFHEYPSSWHFEPGLSLVNNQ